MQKQIDPKVGYAVIALALLLFFATLNIALTVFYPKDGQVGRNRSLTEKLPFFSSGEKEKMVQFSSVSDFKEYLDKSQSIVGLNNFSFGRGGGMEGDMAVSSESAKLSTGISEMAVPSAPSSLPPQRVSETNVQVLGIDEPDIVKTDGNQIYYSQPRRFYPIIEKMMPPSGRDFDMGIIPPPRPEETGKTKVIDAWPPEGAKIIADIEKNGELLLYGDILIIFSENRRKIYGYDVSDPQNPLEKWTVELKDNSDLLGARLTNGTVYLATRDYIRPDNPCPIEPFIISEAPLSVSCREIYHPVTLVPTDITYNLLSFDARTGSVKEKASFTGYFSNSVLYMSQEAIYLTYQYPGNFVKILADFLDKNRDLVPAEMADKIRKIEEYDISESAKYTELTNILDRYTRALSDDDRMKMQNEIANRMDSFTKEHGRELMNTGIVKIGIPKLDIKATGKVPGEPLNQFSLDEYEDNLRIATTTSGNVGWGLGFGFGGRSQSTSDVYVLDSELNNLGAVLDLGVGERIYSVRFIEDKGYVVTFKQIDPFFVLDLSQPNKPELKGQLKIPGYSSYLHPLSEDVIVGAGEEDGRVKLTMFDVSSPANPKELNTYKLDEYWSEIASTHHAFLLDKKHQVFFLPGGQGGYIFSYKDNQLKLEKAVSGTQTRRALFINDFLYVIGDDRVTILDEGNWDKVKELDLN